LVSTARSLGAALNRRDFTANEYLPAEVEFHPRPDYPNPRIRRGGDEITAYFEELVELFPDYRVELVGVEDPGDDALVFRWRGTGTGGLSGASGGVLVRQTIEFRRGRVIRIREDLDRA
jgi:hypothetical protein